MSLQTKTLSPDASGLARAARLLEQGALVAFPTETVYGLGADACNDRAVAEIYAAKGRPSFNPLIVHVPDLETAEIYGVFNDLARDLARAFWPGALTLVVERRRGGGLSELVTAGLDTVALRVPQAPVAQALLRAFGGPVAAPSANPSGRISPTCAEHVRDGLSGRIAAVVDGGAAQVGVESTILGCWDTPRLLRPGGVPAERLSEFLGRDVIQEPVGDTPTAPGQLASHYAPRAQVRLDVLIPRAGEVLLGFGAVPHTPALNLSPSADLTEAASHLFDYLRRLDATGAPIAVSPIPDIGLGRAINDRLKRAAAPRP
jgi:L-threonylcarbamoyladenylate synthase